MTLRSERMAGESTSKNDRESVSNREEKETTTSPESKIDCRRYSKANNVSIEGKELIHQLNTTDVLSGRGNGICNWPGNITFRRIIWEHKARYEKALKSEKAKIAKRVIELVENQNPPGRFLEKVGEGVFVLANRSRVKEKTLQALREKGTRHQGVEQLADIEGLSPSDKSDAKQKRQTSNESSKRKRKGQRSPNTGGSSRDRVVAELSDDEYIPSVWLTGQMRNRGRVSASSRSSIPRKNKLRRALEEFDQESKDELDSVIEDSTPVKRKIEYVADRSDAEAASILSMLAQKPIFNVSPEASVTGSSRELQSSSDTEDSAAESTTQVSFRKVSVDSSNTQHPNPSRSALFGNDS